MNKPAMTPEQLALYKEWDRISMHALTSPDPEDLKALYEIGQRCREAEVPGFYAKR